MSDTESNLNALLAQLRDLMAQWARSVVAAQDVTSLAKRVTELEKRDHFAAEITRLFALLDQHAKAGKRLPDDWMSGREVSDEDAVTLIEHSPELEALGVAWVKNLRQVGFRGFQMTALVRQVRGEGGAPGGTAPRVLVDLHFPTADFTAVELPAVPRVGDSFLWDGDSQWKVSEVQWNAHPDGPGGASLTLDPASAEAERQVQEWEAERVEEVRARRAAGQANAGGGTLGHAGDDAP
jgi:hypothetical protein